MSPDLLFCVSQKAFIEKDGRVLVLNDPIEGLDFPGGKIQEGEVKDGDPSSLLRSLQREVLEETGLEVEIGHPFAVWYHEFPKDHKHYPRAIYIVGFKCRHISGKTKLSHEHDRYQWVDKETYPTVDDGSDFFDALEKYFN